MSQTVTAKLLSPEALRQSFTEVREKTRRICSPLLPEDSVAQPAAHVSPPKWHLAHTTWFFETFILKRFVEDYREFSTNFGYLFNSYYETLGKRVSRDARGTLTRPSLSEVLDYRRHTDACMDRFFTSGRASSPEIAELIEIGLHHEMQHQELLYTDIKFILGTNPLYPVYDTEAREDRPGPVGEPGDLHVKGGTGLIGYSGKGFSYDNEHGRHKVYLEPYSISAQPVTYGEYIEFIEAGGYEDHRLWHADGWDWLHRTGVKAPMYMFRKDGAWMRYTLSGLLEVNRECPVMHVNFYEASAYAAFAGRRIPTEAEWEVSSARFSWGQSWEWTGSAYLPYPGYLQPKGAVGEYNGKFMVNQMVLRGASPATFPGHSRATYRNFFQPPYQWQFTGIRTAALQNNLRQT